VLEGDGFLEQLEESRNFVLRETSNPALNHGSIL